MREHICASAALGPALWPGAAVMASALINITSDRPCRGVGAVRGPVAHMWYKSVARTGWPRLRRCIRRGGAGAAYGAHSEGLLGALALWHVAHSQSILSQTLSCIALALFVLCGSASAQVKFAAQGGHRAHKQDIAEVSFPQPVRGGQAGYRPQLGDTWRVGADFLQGRERILDERVHLTPAGVQVADSVLTFPAITAIDLRRLASSCQYH